MLLLFICRRHPHLNSRVSTDNRATLSENDIHCYRTECVTERGRYTYYWAMTKRCDKWKAYHLQLTGNDFESDACLQSRNPRYSRCNHLCATWCRLAPVSPSTLSSGAESVTTVISSLCWSHCVHLINLFASTLPAFFTVCRNTQYCIFINIQTH